MTLALAIPAALLALPASAALAAPVGTETVQTTRDSNAAGQAEAFKVVAGGTASIRSLHVYLDSASSARSVHVALYAGSSKPTNKLGGCSVTSPVAGWNACALASSVSVSKYTTYWTAILQPRSTSGTVRFRDRYKSGSVSYTSSSNNLSSLPTSFRTASKYSSGPVSIYGSATAVTTKPPSGSAPSSPSSPTDPGTDDPGTEDPGAGDPETPPSGGGTTTNPPSGGGTTTNPPSGGGGTTTPPPSDQDGDGIPDSSDQCPTSAGAAPSGCPTSTTPPSNGNNCMQDPSACGYPDVENTGVEPGVTLTPVSGNVTLNTPGQVYENKVVTGKIDVYAPNVTIRNVKLLMRNEYYGIEMHTNGSQPGNAKSTIIDHVEIDANGYMEAKGIAFNEYKASHVFFHNGSDCAHLGENASITDSLCSIGPDKNGDGWEDNRTFCNDNGPHYDGLQTDFGFNQVYKHNTIRNPCGQTSAILISTNTSAIRDVTISDNLMAGGGYTLYCDAGPQVGGTEIVTGNRIAKTYYGAGRSGGSDSGSSGGGYWGPTTGCQNADTYSGNVWDDTGQPIR